MAGQGTHGNQGGQGNIRDRAEQTGAQIGAAAGRKVGETAERAQQAGSSATQRAQDTASGLTQKAQDAASNVAQKAQDFASNVGQRAQDIASNVKERAQDAASTAAERAQDALSGVGDRMSNWGHQLREGGPREGMVGSAASAAAGTLEAGGQYLQQHNFSDMVDDLSDVVRNYPLQSLFIAFGVGCFLGMASRR